MRTSLGVGGTCEELEDEFEENSEGFEEASESGDLSNPGEFDAGEGADIPDDPNVDIDVETDVEAEVETDIDVDIDVDVTLELFFEDEIAHNEPGVDFVAGPDPAEVKP